QLKDKVIIITGGCQGLGRGFLANCKYQFAALFFNLLIYKKLIFKKNWYAFCSKGMRLITGVKESDETGGQQC
ncbi:hypothetical protein, partial [Pseudomonas aeruginosa]|uniref:hypothetical protein n=1 Tax=Pseudomonas aeruginosa TaxID=287 RepID=UPI00396924BF